ncbi:hypothetical protein PYW07_000513 [Mythimna separata]|uniref:peptidylprolyl isomerase n=1 Tax=Mythimna separata TaxID=271217 RepID=A0AAD7Z315_MYTSE|nr:hypothetical protein PYW07_000513 [Mythimna separata]
MSAASSSGGRSVARASTPAPSQSSENTSDQSSKDWLREAVRLLNSADRSARAAHLAFRSSSAFLRPAENLATASAISMGSAANCILAASSHLCSIAKGPNSPVPGLFFAIRRASISVCGGTRVQSSQTPLGRAMRSTAISLAITAASFEEAALEAAMPATGTVTLRPRRERSRSPRTENPRDSVPRSETSRSRSSRSRARRDARSSRGGTSSDGSRRQAPRNGTQRERNAKISHILIKHKESRRPIDNNDKPVTRTKDQAMLMVIDIHEKISKDLITFADAAFSYSECTSARHLGDIQKQFNTGRVQKSFEDAAYALVPGQVSHIIESNSGYHILQRRE